MEESLVSIIIPSYNGSNKVADAVNSVLTQTYSNVEVIVVDDNGIGTPEQKKTAESVAQFEENSNFHYVTHECNKHGSAARNTGAKAAKGAYLGFLDDDDVYYPNYVQLHMDVHKTLEEEYALTYCSSHQYRNDVLVKENIKSASGSLLYEVLMHKVVVGSTSLMIRKDAFDALGGFDESFRRHQDWEFTARVAANYKVRAIEKIGFRRNLEYRNSPKNYETAKNYRVHYIEKMMPYIKTLPKKQQKDVIASNYVDVIMQLLRKRQFGKFIKEYREFKLGFYGVSFVLRAMYSYVFVNKNFWTLKKRK